MAEILKVQWSMALGPKQFGFDLHYEQTDGAITITSLNEFRQQIEALMKAEILDCLSEQVNITSLRVAPITGAFRIPSSEIFLDTNEGTVADQPLPLQCAAVIKLRTTATSGRHNGRIFLGGLGETMTTDGVFNAGALVALEALAETLDDPTPPTASGALETQPVVLTRFVNNIPVIPPIPFPIVSTSVDPNPHLQRRRTVKNEAIRTS